MANAPGRGGRRKGARGKRAELSQPNNFGDAPSACLLQPLLLQRVCRVEAEADLFPRVRMLAKLYAQLSSHALSDLTNTVAGDAPLGEVLTGWLKALRLKIPSVMLRPLSVGWFESFSFSFASVFAALLGIQPGNVLHRLSISRYDACTPIDEAAIVSMQNIALCSTQKARRGPRKLCLPVFAAPSPASIPPLKYTSQSSFTTVLLHEIRARQDVYFAELQWRASVSKVLCTSLPLHLAALSARWKRCRISTMPLHRTLVNLANVAAYLTSLGARLRTIHACKDREALALRRRQVKVQYILEQTRRLAAMINDKIAENRPLFEPGQIDEIFLCQNRDLGLALRPYQVTGVQFLYTACKLGLNTLLSDEMGLGKTAQTIALLSLLATRDCIFGPHIIIVPSSIVYNWVIELQRWAPFFNVCAYVGTRQEREAIRAGTGQFATGADPNITTTAKGGTRAVGWYNERSYNVIVTSYSIAVSDAPILKRRQWFYMVLDEAHIIRNSDTRQWATLAGYQAARKVLLSGTPLSNNMTDLWSLLHVCLPSVFRSRADFVDLFGSNVNKMVDGEIGVNYGLISQIHSLLRPFVLRRLKQEVEDQLPKKSEYLVPCPMTTRQILLYSEVMTHFERLRASRDSGFFKLGNVLMSLRKICDHPYLFDEGYNECKSGFVPKGELHVLSWHERGGVHERGAAAKGRLAQSRDAVRAKKEEEAPAPFISRAIDALLCDRELADRCVSRTRRRECYHCCSPAHTLCHVMDLFMSPTLSGGVPARRDRACRLQTSLLAHSCTFSRILEALFSVVSRGRTARVGCRKVYEKLRRLVDGEGLRQDLFPLRMLGSDEFTASVAAWFTDGLGAGAAQLPVHAYTESSASTGRALLTQDMFDIVYDPRVHLGCTVLSQPVYNEFFHTHYVSNNVPQVPGLVRTPAELLEACACSAYKKHGAYLSRHFSNGSYVTAAVTVFHDPCFLSLADTCMNNVTLLTNHCNNNYLLDLAFRLSVAPCLEALYLAQAIPYPCKRFVDVCQCRTWRLIGVLRAVKLNGVQHGTQLYTDLNSSYIDLCRAYTGATGVSGQEAFLQAYAPLFKVLSSQILQHDQGDGQTFPGTRYYTLSCAFVVCYQRLLQRKQASTATDARADDLDSPDETSLSESGNTTATEDDERYARRRSMPAICVQQFASNAAQSTSQEKLAAFVRERGRAFVACNRHLLFPKARRAVSEKGATIINPHALLNATVPKLGPFSMISTDYILQTTIQRNPFCCLPLKSGRFALPVSYKLADINCNLSQYNSYTCNAHTFVFAKRLSPFHLPKLFDDVYAPAPFASRSLIPARGPVYSPHCVMQDPSSGRQYRMSSLRGANSAQAFTENNLNIVTRHHAMTHMQQPDISILMKTSGKLLVLQSLLAQIAARREKVIIFAQLTKCLDILEIFVSYLKYAYVRMDGSDSIRDRQRTVELFNYDDGIFLFLLSTRAGGLGLNLTSANNVIFFNNDYNPNIIKQCQDRVHRINQQRNVNIYYLISEYTIEENIYRRSMQKKNMDRLVMIDSMFVPEFYNIHGARPQGARQEDRRPSTASSVAASASASAAASIAASITASVTASSDDARPCTAVDPSCAKSDSSSDDLSELVTHTASDFKKLATSRLMRYSAENAVSVVAVTNMNIKDFKSRLHDALSFFEDEADRKACEQVVREYREFNYDVGAPSDAASESQESAETATTEAVSAVENYQYAIEELTIFNELQKLPPVYLRFFKAGYDACVVAQNDALQEVVIQDFTEDAIMSLVSAQLNPSHYISYTLDVARFKSQMEDLRNYEPEVHVATKKYRRDRMGLPKKKNDRITVCLHALDMKGFDED